MYVCRLIVLDRKLLRPKLHNSLRIVHPANFYKTPQSCQFSCSYVNLGKCLNAPKILYGIWSRMGIISHLSSCKALEGRVFCRCLQAIGSPKLLMYDGAYFIICWQYDDHLSETVKVQIVPISLSCFCTFFHGEKALFVLDCFTRAQTPICLAVSTRIE